MADWSKPTKSLTVAKDARTPMTEQDEETKELASIGEDLQQYSSDKVANGTNGYQLAKMMVSLGVCQLIRKLGEDDARAITEALFNGAAEYCENFDIIGITEHGSAS